MAEKVQADELTRRIIKQLYDNDAGKWSIQQKGTLLAAVKLTIQKQSPKK